MDIDKETVTLLYETAAKFESDMARFSQRGEKIAKRTMVIVKSVLGLVGVSAVVIFLLIGGLSESIKVAISNMVDMYQRFGLMSQDMASMTASVTHITENVGGMPVISDRMRTMNSNVLGMRDSVHGMTGNIVRMDADVAVLDFGVQEMTRRFGHLNFTVGTMTSNVNQMARPARAMPGAR
jgi:hypothetical protein